MSSKIRTAVVTLSTSVGLIAGRRAAEAGWRAFRHEDPPSIDDVRDDDASLRDLFLWAGTLAASMAIARRVATSAAARLLDEAE